MDNTEIKNVELAEEYILENKAFEAISILKPLCNKYPKDGRLAFDLGRCAASVNDTVTAGRFFHIADDLGFKNTSMFTILGIAADANGNFEKAEEYYKKALDAAASEYEILLSKTEYALYYIRNEKYLNAEKIAKDLIKNFKNRYNGYHIYFLINYNKQNFDEALNFLETVPESLSKNRDYLTDYILVSEQKLMPKEMMDLLESDGRFVENIPNYTLKKEFNYFHNLNDKKGMNKVFEKLVNDYNDKDALIGLALKFYSEKEYERSAKVANYLIQKYKNTGGMTFALAVYIEIFNIYHLSGEQPSPEAARLIEKGGNYSIDTFIRTNIPQFYEPLVKSVKDLFNEINQGNRKRAN